VATGTGAGGVTGAATAAAGIPEVSIPAAIDLFALRIGNINFVSASLTCWL
jgi:hypothetical protein